MDDDRRCTAHAKGHGGRCKRRARPGATVCAKHGASAPQVKAAAERRVARAQALAHAERTFGTALQGAVDPDALVLAEISHAAGAVGWLREKVAELSADALVWGATVVDDRTSGVGRAGVDTRSEARPSVWVQLYGEERDRLVRMCKVAVDMGVSQRQVELAEALGGQLASVLQSVLDELDLSQRQRVLAREVVPRQLRALTGGLGT